jgi:hypothetical protein
MTCVPEIGLRAQNTIIISKPNNHHSGGGGGIVCYNDHKDASCGHISCQILTLHRTREEEQDINFFARINKLGRLG